MRKNGGREWRPKGSPEPVRVHDFKDQGHGKAIPYGIFDLASEEGWVQVGIDHDPAQFAVNSIRGWWEHLGRERYPDARTLTVTADCGGADGSRTRLWKVELQRLADETGLAIQVCHFPPGTSKWNKIEHRLFSFITINWRGKPLTSLETIVNLIASTTTRSGLKVFARLDEGSYPAKVTVSDAELEAVALQGDGFHPEWNYTIEPRILIWRRLTLDVEGAAGASAYDAVGLFARHLSREVDCTPRSEVLGETLSATARCSVTDAKGQRIRGGWLGRRPFCRRVRRA